MLGLMGRKLGMTQVFSEQDGALVAVTVLEVESNVVVGLSSDEKNGYSSLHLGLEEAKESRLTKAQSGKFKKAGVTAKQNVKEFRAASSNIAVGSELSCSLLQAGDVVNVQSVSKGKGFQGVMRRHHFAGGNDSHGNSVSHRVPGSIGNRAWPGRVFPNKRMAGHMGDETVTVKNLKVVVVEADKNLVLIKGAIPGGKGALVSIIPTSVALESRVSAPKADQAA